MSSFKLKLLTEFLYLNQILIIEMLKKFPHKKSTFQILPDEVITKQG